MRKRCLAHRLHLRNGSHHSNALQRSWDKHGESAFIFVVIENCTEDQLIRREQLFIDGLAHYNSSPTAGTILGMKQSQETKNKHSARMRKIMMENPDFVKHITTLSKGRPKPDHWKETMSRTMKGKKKSDSHVLNMSMARAELSECDVLRICELRRSGMSINDICQETGKGFSCVQRLLDGKSYRWVSGIPSFDELSSWKLGTGKRGDQTVYKFVHNEYGERVCTKKELITEFPEINPSVLTSVCSGCKKTARGWSVSR